MFRTEFPLENKTNIRNNCTYKTSQCSEKYSSGFTRRTRAQILLVNEMTVGGESLVTTLTYRHMIYNRFRVYKVNKLHIHVLNSVQNSSNTTGCKCVCSSVIIYETSKRNHRFSHSFFIKIKQ